MDDDALDAIPFEDLQLDSILGKGKFGKVYKGTYLGTDVAVKLLYEPDDPDEKVINDKYIEREVKILRSMHHPNVVQFMGIARDEHNQTFLITEYLSGKDVRQLYKEDPTALDWHRCVTITKDTATAMTYLHSRKMIHRDLKSKNIVLDENGRAKLCDFGLARPSEKGDAYMTIAGTDEWMAPEVLVGEKYNEKCDVFSFGIVVGELISKKKPAQRFPAQYFEVDYAEFDENVPSDTPKELYRIFKECTAHKPDDRPNFKDILPSLVELAQATPASKPAASAPAKKAEPKGEHDDDIEIDETGFINFDDLDLGKVIGKGNFGQVYKGTYFETPVAIKQLLDVGDGMTLKYIQREMDSLKGISHPNVVQYMGMTKNGVDFYLVTEFVAGGHLRAQLKNPDMDIPWKLRVKYGLDIAYGLNFMHSRNIIHRDLKAKNLLLDDQKVKLCDFGFARDAGASDAYMTIAGTDEWMAPEVTMGDKYNKPADTFSYGVVLGEIITRQKPIPRTPGNYFGLDYQDFMSKVPKECPKEFLDVCLDCYAQLPEERPTMKEVCRRLKELWESMPDEEPKKAVEEPKPESPKKPEPTPAPEPTSAPAPEPAPAASEPVAPAASEPSSGPTSTADDGGSGGKKSKKGKKGDKKCVIS